LIDVYLGMGANLGDRQQTIEKAVQMLAQTPDIKIINQSAYYETEPIGYTAQDWFLNNVLHIRTTLTPAALLKVTQAIEQQLGRVRTIRWGPRTIDIDILFYGEQIINTPDLIIPHPRLLERAFVVIPLLEIAPEIHYPGGQRLAAMVSPRLAEQRIYRLKEGNNPLQREQLKQNAGREAKN